MAELLEALSDADDAGLYYVSDERPGIRRRTRGKGFSYHGPDGESVDAETRTWIVSTAIPPAWTDVWICPARDGHILATGRDARGRKQYRYHPRWREVRDSNKYFRLADFGVILPSLREQLDNDLAVPRAGNDEYAILNESYGLTTMQNEHAVVEGSVVQFEFTGMGGAEVEIDLRDRRLAGIVKAYQELPGEELFQYVDDDGDRVDVNSAHVNAYLRELTGAAFTGDPRSPCRRIVARRVAGLATWPAVRAQRAGGAEAASSPHRARARRSLTAATLPGDARARRALRRRRTRVVARRRLRGGRRRPVRHRPRARVPPSAAGPQGRHRVGARPCR